MDQLQGALWSDSRWGEVTKAPSELDLGYSRWVHLLIPDHLPMERKNQQQRSRQWAVLITADDYCHAGKGVPESEWCLINFDEPCWKE